ncbi:unnamed protein product [Fraxinus pennsylvanica]|uniref:Uncharacterized protein n=1 Tax=Fraxinus pennsylvanica TaxID=56036 RepID=A0AAD2EC21_9LAMI|nr:unnamed protein product [Fraxinus pennsylvanica]
MEVTMAEHGETSPEHKLDTAALYDTLRQSTASVEEVVTKMLAIKKEAQTKSQLRELVTQILLNFVTLRQANRSILLEEDSAKAETERAKASVEFATLQLQSLLYEKNHQIKAIKACKDLNTKYPDIELVPQEEFFRDAPVEIKDSVISKDSEQNLMLKRLNFEIYQRKELCKHRKKLEQRKKALQETVAHRKKFLSSLPSHLKSLKKASLPVQQQLGVSHMKKLKQQQLAELLPPPLYVIYSQLLTLKETFGENIDLELIGNVKDAQDIACQLANKCTGISTNSEDSNSRDVPDDEDDGQRRVKDSEEAPENNILCNLFTDDNGLELPRQSAKLMIGDFYSFHERRTSRPYKWAQHLAGIDFLPENRVQTIVQRIRARIKAQLVLA